MRMIFVAVVMSACAHGTYVQPTRRLCDRQQQVYVSTSLTDDYVVATVEAIELWNGYLGRDVLVYAGRVDDPPPNEYPPWTLVTMPDIKLASAMRDENYLGSVDFESGGIRDSQCIRGVIAYVDEISIGAARAKIVTAHELGHTLGLTHSVMPYTLMFKKIIFAKEKISYDTRASIKRLYGTSSRFGQKNTQDGAAASR